MPVESWVRAFALTVLFEVPIVVALTRRLDVPVWRRAATAFFGQLATHPLVWFFFPFVPRLTGWTSFTVSEVFAWLTEALLYALVFPALGLGRAAGVSAVANGASIAVGLLMLGK